MLETWAKSLRNSASMSRDAIRRGDPEGKGIDYLRGCAATYDDVAEALQASADHARGKRPDEGPHPAGCPVN